MDDRLAARTVVITGAGRGLGLAMAHAAARAGATIVVAEQDPERGEAAEAELVAAGIKARAVRTDVTDEGSLRDLAEDVDAHGGLWALVNNAGLADGVGGKTFYELTVEEWDRVMTVNARGPWLASRALAPQMIAAGGGRIVNVASDAALYGSPRLAHYIASKGALIALTRGMAREVGDAGITVNALAPGLTVGESASRVPEDRHALYAQNRAISRPQQADDVLGAALFLLSDESAFVTGHTLVVDGGFVMS